jgi:hypothetical protein
MNSTSASVEWNEAHKFRELTRVKMRIAVQKQRGELLAS